MPGRAHTIEYEGDGVYAKTLTSHISEAYSFRGPEGQAMGDILAAIAGACKVIGNQVAMSSIHGTYGLRGNGAGGVNATGDDQKELDVVANEIFLAALRGCGRVAVAVSEENDLPVVMRPVTDSARYAVVFDPVDGSSNIECSVSVGTIWGVYRIDDADGHEFEKPDAYAATLRPGREMVAAGYVLYSTSTAFTFSVGGTEVRSFVLDPRYGEYVEDTLRSPLRMPTKPKKIVSVNGGNRATWDTATKEFVDWTAAEAYSHRYIGSMVADVHRTLLYGGIFLYPADAKSKEGKLRMLYECFPMAYLTEAAGGSATNGTTRILDLVPTKIHQRSAIYIGCSRDVDTVQKTFVRVAAAEASLAAVAVRAEAEITGAAAVIVEDPAATTSSTVASNTSPLGAKRRIGGQENVSSPASSAMAEGRPRNNPSSISGARGSSKDTDETVQKFELTEATLASGGYELSARKGALFHSLVKMSDPEWTLATACGTGEMGLLPTRLLAPAAPERAEATPERRAPAPHLVHHSSSSRVRSISECSADAGINVMGSVVGAAILKTPIPA